MTTIHLDPNMVPATMRGSYNGKKFKAEVCTEMTIPADAGLWDGGSRDQYRAINLETGVDALAPGQNRAPWDRGREDRRIALAPGFAVVRHSYFCGKDMGLTFYVHPDNAAKLLPAPSAELTAFEKIVLSATASYKSSYGGMDRYQMALRDARYSNGAEHMAFPSRAEWDDAKITLIGKGMLNKAGAITPAGRNAIPSRY